MVQVSYFFENQNFQIFVTKTRGTVKIGITKKSLKATLDILKIEFVEESV